MDKEREFDTQKFEINLKDKKCYRLALTSVAHFGGCHSATQKVASLVPGQGTCRGCWFYHWLGGI